VQGIEKNPPSPALQKIRKFMSVLEIKVTSGRPAVDIVANLQSADDPKILVNRIAQYLESTSTGTEVALSSTAPPSVNIQVQDSKVQATGTVTFTGTGAANDTILINGVTFTAVASGATGNQWNVGGTATLSAAALAAAINASVTALIAGYVTAANLAGVMTITSAFYGLAGNQTTIAEGVDAGSAMAVSGARLTGGAADAAALTLNF
jgi:hypothetical protein